MQRTCGVSAKLGLLLLVVFVVVAIAEAPVRGDLIRSSPSRTFPDIAGDIVGMQTYTYDPATQTGMFHVENAPHLISLGPSAKDTVSMLPDQDGTLSQSLRMRLDRHGRLVDSPNNKFQIRGTVVIGDQTYQGLLLEGRPTAFGAEAQDSSSLTSKNPDVFDLNMRITGGKLAEAFGEEAYLRIVPQAKSTFRGQFTVDFSSERPLTNLRAARRGLPATVPEPTVLFTFLTCGALVLACRLRRRFTRQIRRRGGRTGWTDMPSARISG
jgi:hypothetical protein